MKFREDINGLRAIAVIAVVLFHFNPAWMPGGFAGVDVFFVISGFLMTGIIFKGIEQENFSILKFYVARANRIIPALAILCFSLIVCSWLYLVPSEYKALGKHAISSVSFLSNIVYWTENSYFAASSNENWLLHTWSLSVEWQFYIIYPLVLVTLSKFMSLISIKKLLVLGTLIGFTFSVVATYKWPTAAYFLFPTRAWEMMLGGIAFLYPLTLNDKQKKFIGWFGILLIFGSYILISKNTPWPGYLAILPVFGSFLVIQAQTNSFITSNKVFQKLGSWSYSIYLWHWPIVVAIFYFSLNEHFVYLGIILSIILGYLSHTYIEKINFTKNFDGIYSYLKCKPLYFSLSVCILGFSVFINDGLEVRSDNKSYSYAIQKEKLQGNYGLHNDCRGFTLSPNCSTDDNPEVLVWGDSFSMHLVSGLVASNPKAKIIQFSKSNCGPFFDITPIIHGNFTKECFEFTESVKKWIKENNTVKYAVLSSPFKQYFKEVRLSSGEFKSLSSDEVLQSFKSTLDVFLEAGIKPIIFSPPPSVDGHNIGKCLDKASFINKSLSDCDIDESLISNIDVFNFLSKLSPNFKVIDLRDYLCNGETCKTHTGEVFIYRDNGHLSYEGSKWLGEKIKLYDLITSQ
ncbi:acyltransferase family protein [Pseudoalteromonas arctica]|uniref:Acyltransferase 3 domain-containing protein n=1 Tax=Pseudoalteromonas arctica A 37-1-2 TaxID=1117313 RepID=A0A290S386_9GAMM|nr:acyltransferase family protein [Pseudoalteromonas arctica]ATC86135.1 hypothetical protein PARC_a1523 [Pseudoalteromonas arctica A 37-1-2]